MDLNADLGESFGHYSIGNDAALLRIVTSANVACGFHAGDPQVMLRTCRLAKEHGVRIGAHPGYHDKVGFGRRILDTTADELYADVLYQVGALNACAEAVGATLEYIKPHGALYNRMASHEPTADGVIRAASALGLPLMVLAGAPAAHWARDAGVEVIEEAFADRAYLPDATLAPRSLPGAVHEDEAAALAQAKAIASGAEFPAIDATPIRVRAQSLCVHGDHPAAVQLAERIAHALAPTRR